MAARLPLQGERQGNRASDIALRIEARARLLADPPLARAFDQDLPLPFAFGFRFQCARLRKYRDQIEIAGDGMRRVTDAQCPVARRIHFLCGRVDHDAGGEHQPQCIGEHLQPAQRFGIQQPQQVAAALAVAADDHQQFFPAARQPQQRAGQGLLIERGEVLAPPAVFDHHLAVAANTGVAGGFRLFDRVHENEAQVGLVALVQRDEFAHQLAHLSLLRIKVGGIHGDGQRPLELRQHLLAGGRQTVQRVAGQVPVRRKAYGERIQAARRRQQQQQKQR